MEVEKRGEWEMEEYRSDETNRGKVSWVLDEGIRLGKKILFTGFVISSAPLAIPPLVVISAIGLVVSIPSGVFLASYACSEKLMRKLFPIPDSEEPEPEPELEGEDEAEETAHRGVKRKIESGANLEDLGVDVSAEENEYEEGKEQGEGEEQVAVVILDEIEEPVVVEQIVVEVTEPVNGGDGGKTEVVEMTIDHEAVIEEDEDGVEENEVAERESKSLIESLRDEGKISDENKTPQQEISKSQGDQSAISTTKSDQTGVGNTTSELPVLQGAEETKNQPGISSEKATPSDSEAKKKKSSKKKPGSQQPQPQKGVYNEEKIWEQIEAVRKIVGYKVTAQNTSIEELKALYIFTGVEPPASFGEPTDLADVNTKLQFLKSIIGVN